MASEPGHRGRQAFTRPFLLGEKRNQLLTLREVQQYGRDIAAVARAAPAAWPMVVDLFAGSGNTLSWITRHTGARRAIGFELDDVVFELASKNLCIARLGIDLRHDSYQHGLQSLGQPGEDLLIVFVSPPWGAALSERSGLDLRRRQPPVAEAIDVTIAAIGHHKLLFAIQVFETVEPDSLAEVTARFPWSAMKVYKINAPGQNPGLLLAARGWVVP